MLGNSTACTPLRHATVHHLCLRPACLRLTQFNSEGLLTRWCGWERSWVKACLRSCVSGFHTRVGERLCAWLVDLKVGWAKDWLRQLERGWVRGWIRGWVRGWLRCCAKGWLICWIQRSYKYTSGKLGWEVGWDGGSCWELAWCVVWGERLTKRSCVMLGELKVG